MLDTAHTLCVYPNVLLSLSSYIVCSHLWWGLAYTRPYRHQGNASWHSLGDAKAVSAFEQTKGFNSDGNDFLKKHLCSVHQQYFVLNHTTEKTFKLQSMCNESNGRLGSRNKIAQNCRCAMVNIYGWWHRYWAYAILSQRCQALLSHQGFQHMEAHKRPGLT